MDFNNERGENRFLTRRDGGRPGKLHMIKLSYFRIIEMSY